MLACLRALYACFAQMFYLCGSMLGVPVILCALYFNNQIQIFLYQRICMYCYIEQLFYLHFDTI